MKKNSSKEILSQIKNKEIDILVGTQLISKGYHFSNLNCIVVLDVDLSSHGYDLRSSEKNLQLYHQLSGRAGRTGKEATVYFQTYDTDSKIISQITNEDPFIFLENELKIREKFDLPPFERFFSIILTSQNSKLLYEFSLKIKNHLTKNISAKILGPVEAPVFRIKKKYRYRILIRSKKSNLLQRRLSTVLKSFKMQPGINLAVDVDPITFN